MFDQELMDKWCIALESGNYAQGKGALRDADKYCCLGILCDVMDSEGWKVNLPDTDDKGYSWYDDDTRHIGVIGYETRDHIGLKGEDQNILVSMNDVGKSFKEICSWIRENLGEE